MSRGTIIVLIAIFCVVNGVAAQSVVNRNDTFAFDYSPINYVAVVEQLNRASQPTAWQRFSDWLSVCLFANNSNRTPIAGRQLHGFAGHKIPP